jgi:hypothetical protein
MRGCSLTYLQLGFRSFFGRNGPDEAEYSGPKGRFQISGEHSGKGLSVKQFCGQLPAASQGEA